jgi:hypothetical protein
MTGPHKKTMISKVETACFGDQSSTAAIQRWARNAELFADPSAAIEGLATLTELLDSLETITGEPALAVLQRAGGVQTGPAEPQPA